MATISGPGAVFAATAAATGTGILVAGVALYKGANAVGKSYFPLAYQKKLTGN